MTYYQDKITKIVYYFLGYVSPVTSTDTDIMVFTPIDELDDRNAIKMQRCIINEKFNKVRLICKLKKSRGSFLLPRGL